jgi:DNA-directed RNA polymerase specialized sigma24 family protein
MPYPCGCGLGKMEARNTKRRVAVVIDGGKLLASRTKESTVALTHLDRDLLKRCLNRHSGAWNDFVDRYLGLVYHVVHHTAHLRSTPLRPEDVEDLSAEVMLQIVANDYAVLRQFRGASSLATYLTVIARRICVQELARRMAAREVQPPADADLSQVEGPADWKVSKKSRSCFPSYPAKNAKSCASTTLRGAATKKSARN